MGWLTGNRRRVIVMGVVALLLLPFALQGVVLQDEQAPPELSPLLPSAKRALLAGLDHPPVHVRYLGLERRRHDELLVIRFELRPNPFVTAEGAYLVSRCRPLETFDADAFYSVGGGRAVTDFETDPELVYLRSDARAPCGPG
jgi:hypothetical protein